MTINALKESDIEEEEKVVEQYLRDLTTVAKRREGLKLTGIEILVLIGAKVVLPIVSGLISRVLYDQYNNIQTIRKAKAAKQAILDHQTRSDEVVDDETIIRDVTQSLISEGIPKDEAKKVTVATLMRIKSKLVTIE